jgi:hypothetical protein
MKKRYLKFAICLGMFGLLIANTALAVPLLLNVSGQVTDGTDGSALVGCSIVEKGTTNGVLSDSEGQFSITVKDPNAILILDFIGYGKKEVVVGNQTNISVKLLPEASLLDDIVVVGYGTQKKSDITGAVGTLKSEDFNKGIVANPGQLLQGKLPV